MSSSLFLKFSGSKEQIQNDVKRTKTITQSNKGSNFTFARDDAEADQIWQSRKIALWSALQYKPGARCWTTDVCVPLSKFPDLITETKRDIDSAGICGPIVSHAGDGNFHALLLFSNDDELRKVEGLVHRMVERAQGMDGTCTGEHGVGIGKKVSRSETQKRDWLHARLDSTTHGPPSDPSLSRRRTSRTNLEKEPSTC